jgi:hypothetical protein
LKEKKRRAEKGEKNVLSWTRKESDSSVIKNIIL